MWSMGCIFLEFMVWLLDGADQLKKFQTGLSNEGNGNFYVIDPSQQSARLSDVVMTRLSELRQDPRCPHGTAVHALLVLIADRLLVTDTENRRDSVHTDSGSDSSSLRSPLLLVQAPTFPLEGVEDPTDKERASAQEMHKSIDDIFNNACSGSLEWMRWDASASARSQRKLYGKHLATTDAINGAARNKNPQVR